MRTYDSEVKYNKTPTLYIIQTTKKINNNKNEIKSPNDRNYCSSHIQ